MGIYFEQLAMEESALVRSQLRERSFQKKFCGSYALRLSPDVLCSGGSNDEKFRSLLLSTEDYMGITIDPSFNIQEYRRTHSNRDDISTAQQKQRKAFRNQNGDLLRSFLERRYGVHVNRSTITPSTTRKPAFFLLLFYVLLILSVLYFSATERCALLVLLLFWQKSSHCLRNE